MKIEGEKYLNQNTYDKLIIDLARDERRIKFVCQKPIATVPSDNKLLKKYKKSYKSDINVQDEMILEILEHFLVNTSISKITSSKHIPYYKGYYSTVESNSRTLMIRLMKDSFFNNDINKRIVDSYYFNRSKYCFNKDNEIESIGHYLGDGGTSFKKGKILLPFKDADSYELHEKDQQFLRELLLYRFDGDHDANITWETYKTEYGGTYCRDIIKCGDFKTKLDYYSKSWVEPIISEYNNELRAAREKQLVLKGF